MKKNEKVLMYLIKNHNEISHIRSLERELKVSAPSISEMIKEWEKEGLVIVKKVGNTVIPIFSFSEKANLTAKLLFIKEKEDASPYIRRWITQLNEIKNADLILLFGGVLNKEEKANDIDVVFVTSQKNLKELQKEIESMNKINLKIIHPIYQSKEDLINNIKKRDKIIINAIKGIVIKGEEEFLKILKK